MERPHQPPMYSPECLRGPCFVPSYSYFTLMTSPRTGINSPMRLFADDGLVYHEIKSPANHLTLRDDINKLLSYEWTERWHMNFNVTKCAPMSLSTWKVSTTTWLHRECSTHAMSPETQLPFRQHLIIVYIEGPKHQGRKQGQAYSQTHQENPACCWQA